MRKIVSAHICDDLYINVQPTSCLGIENTYATPYTMIANHDEFILSHVFTQLHVILFVEIIAMHIENAINVWPSNIAKRVANSFMEEIP